VNGGLGGLTVPRLRPLAESLANMSIKSAFLQTLRPLSF
jgi:hypothetical protein